MISIVFVAYFIWVLVPGIKDVLGLNQSNMDIYNEYVNLQLNRQYETVKYFGKH